MLVLPHIHTDLSRCEACGRNQEKPMQENKTWNTQPQLSCKTRSFLSWINKMWHILKRASLVWILLNCYNQIERTQRNVLHIIKFGFEFIWSILNKGFSNNICNYICDLQSQVVITACIRDVNWILKFAGDHQRCYLILSAKGMEMLAFVSASFSQNDEWYLG